MNARKKKIYISTGDFELPSNRKFGYFFTIIFVATFGYFYVHKVVAIYLVFAVLAVVVLFITLFESRLLLPFNKAWFRLGLLLGGIVNPIVLGLVFFILISPLAIAMRLIGRDELRLKMKPRATHWKERIPVGPEPQSFRDQF